MRFNKIFILVLCFIACLGLVNAACPSGMVSYWTFDDGTAVDTFGSNHGTNYGAIATTGQVGDAFYFTVVALTTVGFGDITPVSEGGKWVTVIMILSGIILIPWQGGQIIKEWLHSSKKSITCKKCGLKFHDDDASHCKSCGNIIYQEFEG